MPEGIKQLLVGRAKKYAIRKLFEQPRESERRAAVVQAMSYLAHIRPERYWLCNTVSGCLLLEDRKEHQFFDCNGREVKNAEGYIWTQKK